eukprot:TRINITY_DN4907_c0_g1_i6.p1 TRINITY_DN4907_c0_g1~~TRINITY_DN4907_c0_g1_i6.p1  ORF type:complete len:574 (+),score=107.40 TRINITY_DN4907_c0_g1_i6:177-1898(+)
MPRRAAAFTTRIFCLAVIVFSDTQASEVFEEQYQDEIIPEDMDQIADSLLATLTPLSDSKKKGPSVPKLQNDAKPGTVNSQAATTSADVGPFAKYPGAQTMLHVSDSHADPFYNVAYFGCGLNAQARPLFLQDQGKPVPDKCDGGTLVSPECLSMTASELIDRAAAHRPVGCPCGVFAANPPFTVLESMKLAVAQFKKIGGRTVLYTGDFASHNMVGTSEAESSCQLAKAVVKATIDMLDAPGMDHLFVMGNNDVIPKQRPLTQSWLDELGAHLRKRNWLSAAELETWGLGGFYKRQLNAEGLCAIALNSNHWTRGQADTKMAAAQLEWLRTAIVPDEGCKGFLIVAHIAVSTLANQAFGPEQTDPGLLKVQTDPGLWKAGDKLNVTASEPLRIVLDNNARLITAEVYGDLNKEYYFMTNKGGFGFSAVGLSRRGGNDPGFQRLVLDSTGRGLRDLESYAMETACEFKLHHRFSECYAPHFNEGINAATVLASLRDTALGSVRKANVAPQATGFKKSMLKNSTFANEVRNGRAGCSVPSADVVVSPGASQQRRVGPSPSPHPPLVHTWHVNQS